MGNVNGTAGLVAQLVRAGADVNLRTIPRTRKWRWILRFARWASEHGTKSGLLQALAGGSGGTPLMKAARQGKVADVRQLLEVAADLNLRNDQGLTALDLARSTFGGHVPPPLREPLDPNAHVRVI